MNDEINVNYSTELNRMSRFGTVLNEIIRRLIKKNNNNNNNNPVNPDQVRW